ncbi:MAG: ribonuclease Z [Bacteroidales bacterium]|nr:ribonuclease Z [Bacteroidales bacterium]
MNFKIQILGSNSAIPYFNRFNTAQIITVHNEPYLIDCGEGTQIQMRRYAVKYSKINNIFISHLHGDHYFGLFGLLSTYKLNSRNKALTIYSDPKLEKMLKSEFSPINLAELGFDVFFVNLPKNDQVIFENKHLSIKTINLKHGIDTKGFLFEEKNGDLNISKDAILKYKLSIDQILSVKAGNDLVINGKVIPNKNLTLKLPSPRSFAFCSDTAYHEPIIKSIKNIDLLYHEATYCQDNTEKAAEVLHSTVIQAATIAQKANVKQLIIGHFSSSITNLNLCLAEAKPVFDNTILAKDGLTIEITRKHELIVTE